MHNTERWIVCIIAFIVVGTAFPYSLVNKITESVSIMPDATFDGDFKVYTNQKSGYFREKYSCEQNMNADLTFLSVNNTFFWMFRPELKAGLGDSQSGMVLHPFDISFGLIPTFEYRFKRFHVSSGLDHRCFHVIDRSPPKPIVYWNKFILGINSPHRRMHPMVGKYLGTEWNLYNRLIWCVTWGYYISDFFGLVSPQKLMTISRPHYRHDFNISTQYGIYKWNRGALVVTDAAMFGNKRDGKVYWSEEIGAEILFAGKKFDTALFIRYTIDGGRFEDFDSKDRLLEFGLTLHK